MDTIQYRGEEGGGASSKKELFELTRKALGPGKEKNRRSKGKEGDPETRLDDGEEKRSLCHRNTVGEGPE